MKIRLFYGEKNVCKRPNQYNKIKIWIDFIKILYPSIPQLKFKQNKNQRQNTNNSPLIALQLWTSLPFPSYPIPYNLASTSMTNFNRCSVLLLLDSLRTLTSMTTLFFGKHDTILAFSFGLSASSLTLPP